MSKKKDILIIEKLQKGVQESYADLYRDYYGMVDYFVIKNNGTSADSSDVFQDVVIALFEMVKRKDFELTAAISTLIYSIARNIWFSKLKKTNKEVSINDFEKYIPIEENKEEELAQKEGLILKMEDAIHALGDPCKGILIQYYYLKKKMKEIAEHFKYTNAAHAKNQKYKCLERLKKSMLT